MTQPFHGARHKIPPNKILYISNIPIQSNTVSAVWKHFKRYGRIKAIHSIGSYAIIEYTTVEEAVKAKKSSEAFLNNRLIHYNYHSNPTKAACRLSSIPSIDMSKIEESVKLVESKIDEVNQQVKNEIEEKKKHISETKSEEKSKPKPKPKPKSQSQADVSQLDKWLSLTEEIAKALKEETDEEIKAQLQISYEEAKKKLETLLAIASEQ